VVIIAPAPRHFNQPRSGAPPKPPPLILRHHPLKPRDRLRRGALRALGGEVLLGGGVGGEAEARAFAALILIQRLAPDPSRPWRRAGALAGGWRLVVVVVGLPLVGLGALADRALRPLLARPGWSNTYRVLARRVG